MKRRVEISYSAYKKIKEKKEFLLRKKKKDRRLSRSKIDFAYTLDYMLR